MEKNQIDVSKIKILICCHKPCKLPKDDIFLPIQVGAAISDIDLGMQRDDQVNGQPCDNISAKNKSYCELTAMYWAWKNIKKIYPDLEYIGLNHYRRYFDFEKFTIAKDVFIKKEERLIDYRINKKVFDYLAKGHTIVAKEAYFNCSLWTQYCLNHFSDDIRVLKNVISELYPDYLPSFNKIMNGNTFIAYNMSIISFRNYDSYCEWLFGVLFEIERRIDITNYSDYQKRIFGFMSERLFKVWLTKNRIDMKKIPVVQFDNNREDINGVLYLKRNFICNLKHRLNKI